MNAILEAFLEWAKGEGIDVDYEEDRGSVRWVAAPGELWRGFQAGWEAKEELDDDHPGWEE